MTEQEVLKLMIAPGQVRPSKPYRGGVIQILVTSSCNLTCFNCTQGSNLARPHWAMTPEQFEDACKSLKGYFGVIGVFGGNPTVSKHFGSYCEIMRRHFPREQRGLWCNDPLGWGKEMRETFDPGVSNLNVHLSQKAFDEFKRDWPECNPVGLHQDSRHSPPFVAMKDVIEDESERWELIADCDINKFWSAMLGVFRGSLRAWFCEVAGAQSILHQWDKLTLEQEEMTDPGEAVIDGPFLSPGRHDYTYPDTGIVPFPGWWRLPMEAFAGQVRKHCHECGVPLRGRGELAQAGDASPDPYEPPPMEQTSKTHENVYRSKRPLRIIEVVTDRKQLGEPLARMTDYIGNAKR